MLRKVLWRSDIGFYRRPESRTGEMIFSGYPASAPIAVWSYDHWISDEWDPLSYGREYDWNRPFFEQFGELIRRAPWPSLAVEFCVDSPYCNNATAVKNSYLTFGSSYVEDSFYSFGLARSRNVVDSCYLTECELNYESVLNRKCYHALFSNKCKDCTDVYFCENCSNVTDCFGCVNLRGKSYCIFNEQKTKEEYQAFLSSARLGSAASLAQWLERSHAFWMRFPKKFIWGTNNTNVSGDNINNSKNVRHSFLIDAGENLKFCDFLYVGGAKDSYDHFRFSNNSELIYDSAICGSNISRLRFCFHCYPACHSMDYCANCFSASDLFGCFGLRKKQYCILNRQYTKGEYKRMVPKIIEHMNTMPYLDKRGRVYRFGEFFPPEYSPLAYNETVAQEYFPLSESEALAQGYRWGDVAEKQYTATMSADDLPDNITAVTDSVLEQVVRCAHDGKCLHPCSAVFRIVPQELQFYRRFGIPLPRLCFNCRHYERLKYRSPNKLWHRQCQCAGAASSNGVYTNTAKHHHGTGQCPNEFETSYAPDRKEIVYCESCYNAEVV
jgi:hypothetical protein